MRYYLIDHGIIELGVKLNSACAKVLEPAMISVSQDSKLFWNSWVDKESFIRHVYRTTEEGPRALSILKVKDQPMVDSIDRNCKIFVIGNRKPSDKLINEIFDGKELKKARPEGELRPELYPVERVQTREQ